MKVTQIHRVVLLFTFVVDHILLIFSDEEIINSLNINPSEVKEIKFVNISDLSKVNSVTPWLQKILSTDLLSQWINTVKEHYNSINDKTDIIITKYSHDLIIKL